VIVFQYPHAWGIPPIQIGRETLLPIQKPRNPEIFAREGRLTPFQFGPDGAPTHCGQYVGQVRLRIGAH